MPQREDLIEWGTDSSGRPILMTGRMLLAWMAVLAHPRVRRFAERVVIVQGPWQALLGDGATASAGFHDGGGPLDLRTTNLTPGEISDLVWAMRSLGWPATWRRDQAHGGMDPHIHGVYAGDLGITFGALSQIGSVFAGGDGLASGGRDYEARPLRMPRNLPEEARMAALDDIAKAVWDKPITPAGGVETDAIPARRMLAQIHNRTSPDKLAAAISGADPSLDPARIKAAVKRALADIGDD